MKRRKLSPAIIIATSYLVVILTGTILLLLPISIADGYSLKAIDSFFISTSSVCVTGLVPVINVGLNFTTFGKVVIAILIQIGGLGSVTIAIYVLTLLGVKIGISERFLIKEALNQNNASGLVKLIKRIVMITFCIEFIGFIINIFVFYGDFPFWEVIGISAFHTVSAFNNCGFDIFGFDNNLVPYANNVLFNLNTSFLIVLGGLGFIVIYDVITKRSWKRLAIHSKIVIKMSLILIVFGTLFLKFSESNNISWLQAYFTSVSTRTAGFSTIDLNTFKNVSILVIMMLMFIGASPVSTGGGIKTTTLYTMIKSITSFSKGKKTITYNRKISEESKLKAFTLTVLSAFAIMFIMILLMIIEENNPKYEATFVNIFFESTSAFGTVGLSMGITPYLYPLSKIIICLLMFIGRIGPFTIFSLWNKNWNKPNKNDIEYIQEKIIIG